jgi:hypothetical protein
MVSRPIGHLSLASLLIAATGAPLCGQVAPLDRPGVAEEIKRAFELRGGASPAETDDDAFDEGGAGETGGGDEEPSDLLLSNFFSDGWSSEWVKRPRKGRAPDMALLRVTTNFLEREVRVDYAYTSSARNSSKVETSQLLTGLIAYGLNRRLMVEVITNYQWNDPPSSSTAVKQNGSGGGALARFQLADTYATSFAFQTRVSEPNRGIGQTATTISPALAGFQDLQTFLGLERIGLYESIGLDSLSGPHVSGSRTSSASYDLSLARSWLEPAHDPVGNLTTFAELFATTDLNGPTPWHTAVTLTPGVRFWFAHENSLTLGVDFPLSHPRPFSALYRVTYIMTF